MRLRAVGGTGDNSFLYGLALHPDGGFVLAGEVTERSPTPNLGSATLALALPATPSLAGLTSGAQGISLDATTASGLGALTNGAILRLH